MSNDEVDVPGCFKMSTEVVEVPHVALDVVDVQ